VRAQLSLVLFLVISLIAVRSYPQGKVSLKTIERWQQKYAIILMSPEDKKYCSGGVVGSYIYTAAHCCAPLLWNGIQGFGYSFDGINKRIIHSFELDGRGNDICRITPVQRERSPIRPGTLIVVDPVHDVRDPALWLINKISYIYDDIALKHMEIQKVYRLSVFDQATQYTLVQGEAIPGTSGSLILNARGEYIGNLAIGLGTNDRNDRNKWIPHVFGISLLELTEWFATTP